jgi:hypothetical protein
MQGRGCGGAVEPKGGLKMNGEQDDYFKGKFLFSVLNIF